MLFFISSLQNNQYCTRRHTKIAGAWIKQQQCHIPHKTQVTHSQTQGIQLLHWKFLKMVHVSRACVFAQLWREVITFNSGICFEEYKSLLRRLFVPQTTAQGRHWSFTSLSGNLSYMANGIDLLNYCIFWYLQIVIGYSSKACHFWNTHSPQCH